jgi:hypothetical protein
MRAGFADHAFARCDPGTIQYAMNAAECGGTKGYRRLHAGFVSHVGLNKFCLAAELGHHFSAALDIDISENNIAAIGNNQSRRRRAQARAATGNEKCMILNLHDLIGIDDLNREVLLKK